MYSVLCIFCVQCILYSMTNVFYLIFSCMGIPSLGTKTRGKHWLNCRKHRSNQQQCQKAWQIRVCVSRPTVLMLFFKCEEKKEHLDHLFFHIVARTLCQNDHGDVMCKRILNFYVYMYLYIHYQECMREYMVNKMQV